MTGKTESFMNTAKLSIKHRKCAILQGERTSNRWKKDSTTAQVQMDCQGQPLPIYERETPYTYLGYDINIINTGSEAQAERAVEEFIDILDKIDLSLLPTSAKLQAINTMGISKLNFYFSNIFFTEKLLDKLESEISQCVRHWLNLGPSTSRSFIFAPKSDGGLGIICPQIMYYSKRLSFHLSVLNSTDPNVKAVARHSLEIHMNRRKVPLAAIGQLNFAGYQLKDDGNLDRRTTVIWPRSRWVRLCEMCKRKNIRLLYDEASDLYRFEMTVDEVTVSVENANAFYKLFKSRQIKEQTDKLRSLSSQGRVPREGSNYSYCLSNSHLTNHKLSDDLRSFIVKGRLQLLPCRSLLHLYYPQEYTKECVICRHPYDTAAHVAGGCTKFNKLYQKRHNRIANIVFEAVQSANVAQIVLQDKVVTPAMFGERAQSFTTRHTRPDIVLIDNDAKTVKIIEIAVAFDASIDICYNRKFEKYFPLSLELSSHGFQAEIIVLVVGSFGLVHKRFVSGLKKLSITQTKSKFLAKFISVSAMIGTHIVWMQRCKRLFNPNASL